MKRAIVGVMTTRGDGVFVATMLVDTRLIKSKTKLFTRLWVVTWSVMRSVTFINRSLLLDSGPVMLKMGTK